MVYATGKMGKTVYWLERETLLELEETEKSLRDDGYEDVSIWAVRPDFKNIFFADHYPDCTQIRKLEE
jgi:hypothetical protein